MARKKDEAVAENVEAPAAENVEAPAADIERFDALTIIQSDKYKRYADLLSLFLNDDELYSHDEIESILNRALNTPVKG